MKKNQENRMFEEVDFFKFPTYDDFGFKTKFIETERRVKDEYGKRKTIDSLHNYFETRMNMQTLPKTTRTAKSRNRVVPRQIVTMTSSSLKRSNAQQRVILNRQKEERELKSKIEKRVKSHMKLGSTTKKQQFVDIELKRKKEYYLQNRSGYLIREHKGIENVLRYSEESYLDPDLVQIIVLNYLQAIKDHICIVKTHQICKILSQRYIMLQKRNIIRKQIEAEIKKNKMNVDMDPDATSKNANQFQKGIVHQKSTIEEMMINDSPSLK